MSTVLATELESIDDLLVSLGGISPKRVRLTPAPGTAKVRDVERVRVKTRRICESVDGTLVEKAMGAQESFVVLQLGKRLQRWNDDNGDLGMIRGESGTLKLMKALVRAPDLSFTSWDRLPGRVVPAELVPDLAPDLAVEVLSEGNTRGDGTQVEGLLPLRSATCLVHRPAKADRASLHLT